MHNMDKHGLKSFFFLNFFYKQGKHKYYIDTCPLLFGGGGPTCRFISIFGGVDPVFYNLNKLPPKKTSQHIATYKKPPLNFYQTARLDPP